MTIVASNSFTLSNVNDGTNGKTQYTHIAYANIKFLCNEGQSFTLSEKSFVRFGVDTRWVYKEFQAGTYTATNTLWGSDPASGVWKHAELVSNFSNSNSINTTHIGVYVDFVESNSADPSKYNWTLVKGADGTQGIPGQPGSDGKTPYFHTAWSYSVDGMNGFTTAYPNLNLLKNTKSQSYTSTGTANNNSSNIYPLDGAVADILNKSLTISYNYAITNSSGTWSGSIRPTYGLGGTNQSVSNTNLSGTHKETVTLTSVGQSSYGILTSGLPAGTKVTITNLKVEFGSIATPYMPSASEVTTADWPSYIGHYTDFTQADSTNPSVYTWILLRGNDGVPGKVVSNTEPISRFKGLTWKYSGTADLTASDGTAILSGTEYYWSGTKWVLNEINSHNINGDNLNVTNGTFTDGKIKSTWSSSAASGSTEIENSHINMSATDSTNKATNSLGLDVQQGLGMRWSDPTSNQSRSVLLDYGNLSFDRNGISAGLNFDGTNLSSSMPIQAPNTIVKSTYFSVSGIGIRLDRMMSFVAVTFSGQASSTINTTPTINNVLPVGFRPISPYSIDYMIPLNTANNGYIYFNPDGSIRIMATINSGYYIRGTRLYITNDVYPS